MLNFTETSQHRPLKPLCGRGLKCKHVMQVMVSHVSSLMDLIIAMFNLYWWKLKYGGILYHTEVRELTRGTMSRQF
jgi:hypothetical protein